MSVALTPSQRAQLEAGLQRRRAELDQQLAEHQGGHSRAEQAREWLEQDSQDARERDADREVELARSDRELAELGQVSEALKRVHQPEYGWCIDCGQAIAFERLMLEPWTLRCVACEARTEAPGAARHSL